MKTYRLTKNTKALSPVIATIILVAVTVAIAIAVAAWLGALTFTYTRVEQLNITQVTYSATGLTATFGIQNTGTSDVTISSASVNGGALSNAANTGAIGTCSGQTAAGLVPKGTSCSIAITFTGAGTWASGTQYSFILISTQGNKFPYAQIR